MQEKRVNRKAEDSVLRQGKSGQLTGWGTAGAEKRAGRTSACWPPSLLGLCSSPLACSPLLSFGVVWEGTRTSGAQPITARSRLEEREKKGTWGMRGVERRKDKERRREPGEKGERENTCLGREKGTERGEENGERREVRREDRRRRMDWRAARACLTPPALPRVRQVLGAVASPPPPAPGGPGAGPSLQAAAGTIPCWGRKS